jgi:hypothetical protein
MTVTVWKELSDQLAEGVAGGAGWNAISVVNNFYYDSNGSGSGLDEFFQYSYEVQKAGNRKDVLANPSAYISYTDVDYGSLISYTYEIQQPRQSSVSPKFRIVPL